MHLSQLVGLEKGEREKQKFFFCHFPGNDFCRFVLPFQEAHTLPTALNERRKGVQRGLHHPEGENVTLSLSLLTLGFAGKKERRSSVFF